MTPKQNAKELVYRFLDYSVIGLILEESEAKQCALIAVDEIIKATYIDEETADDYGMDYQTVATTNEYWPLVRQEIEKL